MCSGGAWAGPGEKAGQPPERRRVRRRHPCRRGGIGAAASRPRGGREMRGSVSCREGRAARAAVLCLAILGCVLAGRDRQADAACDIVCSGSTCYVGSADGNYYMIQAGQVCNDWWNASAGCKPNDCDGVNKTVATQWQRAAKDADVCPRLPAPLNQAGEAKCKNPAGAMLPYNCYAGCVPKTSR